MNKRKGLRRINKLKTIGVFSAISFILISGTVYIRNRGGADAATAVCYGQTATFTALTPSLVMPNQTFKISKINVHTNVTIATVQSMYVDVNITNANPSFKQVEWTGGPSSGEFDATFPDVTLTATGKAGSKINISVSSVLLNVTVLGKDQSVSCSKENGLLTTNNPGETTQVASINIVSPQSSGGQGVTPGQDQNQGGTLSSNGSSLSGSGGNSTTSTTGQEVRVTALGRNKKPIDKAKIIIDSIPAVLSDSSGIATIGEIGVGDHTLQVIAGGQTATQQFSVKAEDISKVQNLTIQMPAAPISLKTKIYAGVALVGSIIVGLSAFIIRKIMKKRRLSKSIPAAESPITAPAQQENIYANAQNKPSALPPDNAMPTMVFSPTNQQVDQKIKAPPPEQDNNIHQQNS